MVCDQLVNFAFGRKDTFMTAVKSPMFLWRSRIAPDLRRVAIEKMRDMKIKHHDKGTILVVSGPRFSTKAESCFFAKQAGDIINMTATPKQFWPGNKACAT